jgi:hypothetical protein
MQTKEELIKLELLERKYLNKYYHFLKFAEDELLEGFQTKYRIHNDWKNQWNPEEDGKGISDFAAGAERIIYSLLNGKGIGQPISAPVGSDLFFEVSDAFIHIDLKTVQTRNINDFVKTIFVGNNQNSYNGNLNVSGKTKTYDYAALPHYYTIESQDSSNGTKKPCLTYFITILYEESNLNILMLNIVCMPNGALYETYTTDVLSAGKKRERSKEDPDYDSFRETVRFKFKNCDKFKLLDEQSSRIKIVIFDKDMETEFLDKLTFLKEVYQNQPKSY